MKHYNAIKFVVVQECPTLMFVWPLFWIFLYCLRDCRGVTEEVN